MTNDPYASLSGLAERVKHLEMLLTHLESTVADLNDVLLAQHKTIDALERQLGRLASDFGAAQNAQQEERKPEDEKPPHY